MALHHPILCTSRLCSASLQVAPLRALHLECKSSTDKLGAVSTPSRHREKHDNNDTIGPRGGGKNKGKKHIHPFAPKSTSRGSGESGHHPKVTSARPIMPIYHHTNIDKHLWKPHSARMPDDIVEALKVKPDILFRDQLFANTPVAAGRDFDLRGNSTNELGGGDPKVSPKEEYVSPRLKKAGGYGVPQTPPPPPGGHKPTAPIYMDKLMGKRVPEWFLLEMRNELTKCWPHWKNIKWTMKDRSRRMLEDIGAEVDSDLEKMKVVQQAGQAKDELDSKREKMKVVQQARQAEEARNRELEEEVQQLRAKQTRAWELVLKLQADMVICDQMVAPRGPPHPPHPSSPHSHSLPKPVAPRSPPHPPPPLPFPTKTPHQPSLLDLNCLHS